LVGEDKVSFFIQHHFKVSGYVKKTAGNELEPVSGSIIQFYKNGQAVGWARTDSMGNYEKKDLLPGDYIIKPVSLTGEKYRPESKHFSLVEGELDKSNQNFIQINDPIRVNRN